jgi:hypothetical protein
LQVIYHFKVKVAIAIVIEKYYSLQQLEQQELSSLFSLSEHEKPASVTAFLIRG